MKAPNRAEPAAAAPPWVGKATPSTVMPDTRRLSVLGWAMVAFYVILAFCMLCDAARIVAGHKATEE